jgi:hypothetical protein
VRYARESVQSQGDPRHASAPERARFAAFLNVLPDPFWVARGSRSGTVVGCGGVSLAMVSALLILRFGSVLSGGIAKR